MISAVSVKDWVENYKWWKSECKKYDLNIYDLMMLEVRNSDWTEESIQDYNHFLNFLLQDFYLIVNLLMKQFNVYSI